MACGFLVSTLLLSTILGPLTPLIVMAFVPFCALLNRHRMPNTVAAVAPIVLLPILALMSVMWSQAPEATLRYGTLYLATVVAGGFLGAALKPDEFLKGLVFSLAFVALISLPLGRFVVDGRSGELAFAGLQGSKNAYGEIAGLSLIVCLSAVAYFAKRRSYVWLATSVLGLLLAMYGLFLAKATGALLASFVAVACLVCWLVSMRMSRALRNTIFILTGSVVLLLLVFFDLWFTPLFETVLERTGKSVGLAGRALLWREADEQIAANPILGRGYNAFWVQGNLEAERLWRAMGIAGRVGFNFHNTFREILVDLGYVGLTFFGLIAVGSTAVLGARALVAPTVPLVMALALVVYFAIKLPFETFGFGGMHLLSMLLYTCWAMGFASLWTALRR